MTVALDSVEAVCEAVRGADRILPVAGGTKPALSDPPDAGVVSLDVSSLRGIVEYDPAELTLTALAGTPLAELDEALAAHGQYLPFDPPLAAAGATLGGTVAAGLSGSGAFRYGGVRDFVIGVRFVDGTGTLVAGGGKVVKNAAGFDLPKLMTGSIGRLGVLVQLSLKVFPRPPATTTVVLDAGSTPSALNVIAALARGPLELDALDLDPPGRVLVRIGGAPETLAVRATRLQQAVGIPAERLDDESAGALWRDAAGFAWRAPGSVLARVALTPSRVEALQAALGDAGATARYALAANLAWVAWPGDQPRDRLDDVLRTLDLPGMALTGPPGRPLLGTVGGGAFAQRIRGALDPDARFPQS